LFECCCREGREVVAAGLSSSKESGEKGMAERRRWRDAAPEPTAVVAVVAGLGETGRRLGVPVLGVRLAREEGEGLMARGLTRGSES